MAQLLVNLDAMIARADFAQANDDSGINYESKSNISIQDLTSEGLLKNILRKPDFQRETNHWTPIQIVSLLESFINGDLIPSVILWKSPTFVFVIDGGHRLSVLRSWIEDDYGDGPISVKYFGNSISGSQKKSAEKTRKLVSETIGSYQHFKTKIAAGQVDFKISSLLTRALPIQWVNGDADKAESSFFKINTQGTPLDEIEETLLRSRKKPIALSARAIIRAGMGHKYWSKFNEEYTQKIESFAKKIHTDLFDPEISTPIKTLDLPLGGSKGVRSALQIIIDFIKIACITQSDRNISIDYMGDDDTGEKTFIILKKTENLVSRITGNSDGSLGLHPAIYYYGPSGVHSAPLFLGTAKFISEKLSNNDKEFFRQFTLIRNKFEKALIENKELIATALQKLGSRNRVDKYSIFLNSLFMSLKSNQNISEVDIVDWIGVSGKVVVGIEKSDSTLFSDESKSRIFINTALKSSIKCEICQGYIDTEKSVSYDHIIRKQDGGNGHFNNGQITHPYCNQAFKN